MKSLESEVRIIREKGRHPDEQAVILISEGVYKGYGFIDQEMDVSTLEDIESFIIPQKNTLEAQRIVEALLPKLESFVL